MKNDYEKLQDFTVIGHLRARLGRDPDIWEATAASRRVTAKAMRKEQKFEAIRLIGLELAGAAGSVSVTLVTFAIWAGVLSWLSHKPFVLWFGFIMGLSVVKVLADHLKISIGFAPVEPKAKKETQS